jgi:hypothetical protein
MNTLGCSNFAVPQAGGLMKFIQIIEFTTSVPDEVTRTMDEFIAQTEGRRAVGHGYTGRDREKANKYVSVIVFPSYEDAMRNNDLPETQAFAEKMMKFCDEVTFHNLDVIRDEE